MRKILFPIVSILALLGAAGCHPPVADTASVLMTTPTTDVVDYSHGDAWLCLPSRDGDLCDIDQSATVIQADGSMTLEPFVANPSAAIDCFYVYPTVSNDVTGNSDLVPGPGEIGVINAQFARFASVCQPYAPLYRQVTLTALRARFAGKDMGADREMAYNDVKAAWEYYLTHYNKGRGVVLIGHSQGSGVLTGLIAREIDGKPAQDRIISALLLGTRLAVPAGELVGGTFKTMPLCTSESQTGCVVTFASFRDTVPPPADTLFGRVPEEGMIAACNNPASLAGGPAELHAYLSAGGPGVSSGDQGVWADGKAVSTPYVSVPGLLTGECVSNERGSYLQVSVHGDPSDPRTDTIAGDVVQNGVVSANWGLHLIDVHLVMGDLIDLVRTQGESYLGR